MAPGYYGKDPLKFQKVAVVFFWIHVLNLSDYIRGIDVEGDDKHSNVHRCMSL